MIRYSIAAALVSLVAAPVVAQDASPDAAPPATAKPAKEKKACRRDEEIGSNMPHSVCHTKAEWAEIDKANDASVRQTYASGHQGAGGH